MNRWLTVRALVPVFLGSLGAAVLPLGAADDARVVGTWKWTFAGQDGTSRTRELKIKSEGGKLSGVVVREGGQETAVKDLKFEGDTLKLSYSIERNGQTIEVAYEGKVSGDSIEGTSRFGERSRPWNARREATAAPAAKPAAAASKESASKESADGWIDLLKGGTLDEAGWKIRADRTEDDGHKNFWTLKDGVLTNKPAEGKGGIDIVHEKRLKDFELHVEFNVPAHSNSGVYLRGIYEIQVEDTAGRPPADNICGAVYGQKAVSENAAKPAGEWQTFDITLKDNKVTVIHNGKKVIDAFEVKGKTGSALPDSIVPHGAPGPLLLQGDHGEVQFRHIRIRPIVSVF
ncbi:MAG TPA: DUF1080 domain-containing protein [Planctomycetota bacterium]|nr:DUF1080 domain-containing protein [Planctomycetota bacterium]